MRPLTIFLLLGMLGVFQGALFKPASFAAQSMSTTTLAAGTMAMASIIVSPSPSPSNAGNNTSAPPDLDLAAHFGWHYGWYVPLSFLSPFLPLSPSPT